jgi:hypothetical protein
MVRAPFVNWGFLERQQQSPLNQEAAELPATEGTQPAVEDEDPLYHHILRIRSLTKSQVYVCLRIIQKAKY